MRLRKPLVFAAVFGGGLAALLLVADPRGEQEDVGRPAPREVQLIQGEGDDGEPVSAEFRGRLEYTQFSAEEVEGRRPKLFYFLAANVEHLGDEEYSVENLFVELFEPSTQSVRATVRSPKSQMPIRLRGGGREFGEEDRVSLSAVDAEIFDGVPLAPARLEAIELDVALAEGLFTTPEKVVFSAQGARATGRDFTLSQHEERLHFGREGELLFSSEELSEMRLSATENGTLLMERREGGALRVLVEGGARLEASAAGGVEVTAEKVEFLGEDQGSEGFRATSALASGGVVLDGWGGHFEGASARFEFDERGRLREALLEGEPSARIPIENEGGGVTHVDLDASDSVRLLPDAGFSVKGPCVVKAPGEGFHLECDGQLFGTGRRSAGYGWISASGGVRAVLGAHRFIGEDLELRGRAGEGEESEWTVRTKGEAQLIGDVARGGEASYRAQIGGGLELVTVGEEVLIQRATDADLEVNGEQGFRLLAGELREASPTQRVFQASGGVNFIDRQFSGRAEEVSAGADGALELVGAAEEPVRLRLRELDPTQAGEVLAAHVRIDGGELTASGNVRAQLKGGSQNLDLEVGRLEASFLVDEAGAPQPGPVVLSLSEVQRCRVDRAEESFSWSADSTVLSMYRREAEDKEGVGALELKAASASGGVLLERQSKGELLAASGERLEIDTKGEASLLGEEGSLVRLSGVLPGGSRFGRVLARDIRLNEERLVALNATVAYEGGGDAGVTIRSISADKIVATKEEVRLSGGAHIEGDSPEIGPWTLVAEEGRLVGDGEVLASGGFEWKATDEMSASGSRLEIKSETASIEGAPAMLRFAGLEWEAEGIKIDRERMLLEAGKGRVRSLTGSSLEISYDRIQPIEGRDATILGLHRPRFVSGGVEARAALALLWMNQSQGAAQRSAEGSAPSLFGQVDAGGLTSALDEIYIEGHVEVFQDGKRRAKAEAIYLDLVDGRGWLRRARLTVPVEVGGEQTDLAVDAEWLRHSFDGSLTANSARITTCDHADPHYFIKTQDLRLKPSEEEGVRWDISARSNSLVFVGGLTLPLPALEYEADEAGNPLIDRLVLGDTARFGTVLRATVDSELGVIKALASAVTGAEEEDISGSASYRASWLGARGLMLGLGAEVKAEEEFWFKLYADGLYDGATDRGVLRVAEGDRDELRSWVRGRGRATIDDGEWVDFAFSEQSDAGVQAEFFEREFLSYEERETYLHWRKAKDGDFAAAQMKVRAGSFRNEVEELPALAYSRGRAPVFELNGEPVLYSASVDIGRYVRREADGTTISPFDPAFDAVLGTRKVSRFDTRHRLEMPLSVAGGDAQVTPFLALTGTSWSEGIDPVNSPHRGALSVGFDLSTTLWRRSDEGAIHTIAPFLSVSGDLWSEAGEGEPISLDSIDDPLPGDHLDLGVHSRWSDPETGEAIDLSVFGRYARDTGSVLPLEVLGEYLGEVGGRPFAVQHDGRYDLEGEQTLYSRVAIGVEVEEGFSVETGFHHGKDALGEDLFEAASVAARWRVSPKWELEARQTVSLLDSEGLSSRLTLRRYAHDLILDMELSDRAGEGGSSISFSLSPVVGWASSRLGILDHWLAARR